MLSFTTSLSASLFFFVFKDSCSGDSNEGKFLSSLCCFCIYHYFPDLFSGLEICWMSFCLSVWQKWGWWREWGHWLSNVNRYWWCTLLVVEQQLSILQHQSEALVSLTLCMEQHPRILQGFKLQRDDILLGPARPHAEPVDQTAAAIKVGHVRSFGTRKTKISRD